MQRQQVRHVCGKRRGSRDGVRPGVTHRHGVLCCAADCVVGADRTAAAAAAGAGGMAFMFTWLRLSGSKLLDWQRCFSYQPRDITWAQQQVQAQRVVNG